MHLLSSRYRALLAAGALLLARPAGSAASGYYGPPTYLGEGGRLVDATPEFYWELEVKRLAQGFRPPEKRLPAPGGRPSDDQSERDPLEHFAKFTADQDQADFAAALREDRPPAADRADALAQHLAARAAIASIKEGDRYPLPEELPSEFADYHRGAYAFQLGVEHWPEAHAAWLALLARPKEERHYRSVWAAFMLGKLCLLENDPAAVACFRQTRALAREGFADTLGLAADSYGWEAASEADQGHKARSAALFLTQLALGDDSAVASLRGLAPSQEEDWPEAAADPLLRKLTTLHLLAFSGWTQTPGEVDADSRRWITELQKLSLQETEGAEYLGWVAYRAGEYALAERWLGLAAKNAPAGLWLRAKLLRRAGRLPEAAAKMLQAWKATRDDVRYTGWDFPAATGEDAEGRERDTPYTSYFRWGGEDLFTFAANAGGDYGAFRLERAEFIPALDAFRQAGFWFDAAYLAEQVLTTNELKSYVDRQPPEPPRPVLPQDEAANGADFPRYRSLRHLLGRRLMREHRPAEAEKYLPPPYDRIARAYVQALAAAEDPGRARALRARAWFRAGWLCRYAGMELLGTEGPPDNFADRGDFPTEGLGEQRSAGVYESSGYEHSQLVTTRHPVVLKATAAEIARMRRTKVEPDVRFHYRVLGARLMLKAAALLADDTPELAEVLNRAGSILVARDDALADRCYQQLERRCANTALGRAATARRWFVNESGAWCTEEHAHLETLLDKTPPPAP